MKLKLSKPIFLFICGFIITGCETQDLILDAQRHEEILSRKISFEEFSRDNNAFLSVSPFVENNDNRQAQRLTYYAEYGFYVDTDGIVLSQQGDNFSFTLPIYRELGSDKVENLVLSLQKDGSYDVLLFQYNLSEGDKADIVNNLHIANLEEKTTITKMVQRGTGDDPADWHIIHLPDGKCGYIDHVNIYQDGRWDYTYHIIDCPQPLPTQSYAEDGNGGGSNPHASLGAWFPIPIHAGPGEGVVTPAYISGYGVGNSNQIPPILTNPTLLSKTHIKNCAELNENAADADFKTKMEELKNNIPGTVEKGFPIYDLSLAPSPGPSVSCGAMITGTTQHITYGPQTLFKKAIAHNHLSDPAHNHIGVFTPDDMLNLSDLIVTSEDAASPLIEADLSAYLVCPEGNYAIKISDGNKLYNFAVKFANDPIFKKLIEDFYDDNKMKHGESKDDQNKSFLKLLYDYDLGIDLYESDSNFENWQKLNLTNSGEIKKTPC
jgi:hypothetical protein